MGMTLAARYQRSIQEGLAFLSRRHFPTGEFETLVGPDPDLRHGAKHDPSIFTTVNVATSLLEVEDDKARKMVARAADFLLSEMLPGGLWRFWTKAHPGSRGMPPDVDDTVCVSALLKRLGRAFPDHRKMLLANRSRDGRFFTWITPRTRHLAFAEGRAFFAECLATRRARTLYFRSGPQPPERGNIDCVVNTNAVAYLGNSREVSRAAAWVTDVVQDGKACINDRWYQSEAALLYAAARGCETSTESLCRIQSVIAEKAEQLQPGCGSALEVGLVACALNVVAPSSPLLARAIDTIIALQDDDGGWPARVFYYDSYKRALCWGSRELTTGFCVEAIARSSKLSQSSWNSRKSAA
jgi:hypothetical protein